MGAMYLTIPFSPDGSGSETEYHESQQPVTKTKPASRHIFYEGSDKIPKIKADARRQPKYLRRHLLIFFISLRPVVLN
jgi:hypothetical protein